MRNKLRFIKGIVHQNEHSIIIYSLSYIVKSVWLTFFLMWIQRRYFENSCFFFFPLSIQCFGPTDFHCKDKNSTIFKISSLLFHRLKKVPLIQVCNDETVIKWCLNFHFLVNYTFKAETDVKMFLHERQVKSSCTSYFCAHALVCQCTLTWFSNDFQWCKCSKSVSEWVSKWMDEMSNHIYMIY